MDAWIADMKDGRKEKTTDHGTTETCLDSKEPNPEEMQSGAEHQEVPREHAAVKPVGGLRRRHGGRSLATGSRRETKTRSQGSGDFRRKLVTEHRGMNRRVRVARRKGHGPQGHGRDSDARGAQKGRTDVKTLEGPGMQKWN
jgi:hypothetical protein